MVPSRRRAGNARAQGYLALKYDNDMYEQHDSAEALKWYYLAAEQGDSSAQYNLALKYDEGKGLSLDYAMAAKWYRLAAEQGSCGSPA